MYVRHTKGTCKDSWAAFNFALCPYPLSHFSCFLFSFLPLFSFPIFPPAGSLYPGKLWPSCLDLWVAKFPLYSLSHTISSYGNCLLATPISSLVPFLLPTLQLPYLYPLCLLYLLSYIYCLFIYTSFIGLLHRWQKGDRGALPRSPLWECWPCWQVF